MKGQIAYFYDLACLLAIDIFLECYCAVSCLISPSLTYLLWVLVILVKMECCCLCTEGQKFIYKFFKKINNLTKSKALARTKEYPVGVPNDMSTANLLLDGPNLRKP